MEQNEEQNLTPPKPSDEARLPHPKARTIVTPVGEYGPDETSMSITRVNVRVPTATGDEQFGRELGLYGLGCCGIKEISFIGDKDPEDVLLKSEFAIRRA